MLHRPSLAVVTLDVSQKIGGFHHDHLIARDQMKMHFVLIVGSYADRLEGAFLDGDTEKRMQNPSPSHIMTIWVR